MELFALSMAFVLGVFAPAFLRYLATRFPMSPALARLSQSVDRLITAITNNAATEAELAALSDKIDAIVPPPKAAPPQE
jgi:hypothetical protein